MHSIDEVKYSEEVEPILREVFLNDNPFDRPFSPTISDRIVLFPIWTHLESCLIKCLVEAAKKVGDQGCYLSRLIEYGDNYDHCYILLSELSRFYASPSEFEQSISVQLHMVLSPEYVLFSEQGKWGLLVAEHFGVLGGSYEFIEKITKGLPNLQNQVYDWLNWIKNERMRTANQYLDGLPKLDWLLELLTHIYGPEVSLEMMRETGILL